MRTRATRRDWAAVATLGLGVFTVTTTEIMPIGLLGPMAEDLGVSEGMIGLSVTYFAAVAAVASPTLATATRRMDRRAILLVVLALFAVGNALTALAGNYVLLVVIRAVIGLGRSLGLTVAAEGIERDIERDYLREEGCTQGQGYLFGRAMPPSAIVAETSQAA